MGVPHLLASGRTASAALDCRGRVTAVLSLASLVSPPPCLGPGGGCVGSPLGSIPPPLPPLSDAQLQGLLTRLSKYRDCYRLPSVVLGIHISVRL